MVKRLYGSFALMAAGLALAGCNQEAAQTPALKPAEVLVGLPVVENVVDYEFFTGRTESADRVDLRARVTGYLDKCTFQEGAIVKKSDLLFVIDPRPMAAELAKAEATLTQARSHLARLEKDSERAQNLLGRQAVSREEYDRLAGERDEAKAAVLVSESGVRLAKLTLEYTEVRAPFTGRISRRMVDPGNLVKADETILTTLVAIEPMYAYFDVDERTLLRQLMRSGRLENAQQEKLPIQIGLADEEGFPHPGVVNFVDNRVDPNTGTLWLRGQFTEPNRSIKPGIFVRVRFPLGGPHPALLVAEQALGTDQGQKFLFVVDDKNKAAYRAVKVGRLHDGLRVITDGLKLDEHIVVTGLQRVRAGALVAPKAVDMKSRVAKRKAEDAAESATTQSPAADTKKETALGATLKAETRQ